MDNDELELEAQEQEQEQEEIEYDERILALAQSEGYEPNEITDDGNNRFSVGRKEYLVLTDDEAEKEYDEYLDSYIDDVVLPEIPEPYRFYFDDEKWKRDARMDGRASALASYDGNEDSVQIEGTEYFIYRTN